jgi:hypothetical protein
VLVHGRLVAAVAEWLARLGAHSHYGGQELAAAIEKWRGVATVPTVAENERHGG